ncbi:hypothetical protein M422DRAFT_32086 [Sphaerobolus stellatus SS14]|uniref:Uncharacterized protein n=1 Tax=Sphaerobolus stellatus (strain SS14) TaxID=990650 RepID=A0A0C9VSF5_SPHS4|nr:hypothetical protein M422DRAFT_32086 [Sphaerobolus stellatus SS14]
MASRSIQFTFFLSLCLWFEAVRAADSPTCSSHPGSEVPCPDTHKPVSHAVLLLAIGIPVIIVTLATSVYLFFVFRRKRQYNTLLPLNINKNPSAVHQNLLKKPNPSENEHENGMDTYRRGLMKSTSALTLNVIPESESESEMVEKHGRIDIGNMGGTATQGSSSQSLYQDATTYTAGAYYGYSVGV